MTKFFVIFSFLSVFSLNTLFAQTSTSIGTELMSNSTSGVVIGYTETKLSPVFDFFTLTALSSGWGEVYGGFVAKLTEWAKIRAGAGFEQTDDLYRFGGMVQLKPYVFNITALVEAGADGNFYRVMSTYPVSNFLSAGVVHQKDTGTGPYTSFGYGSLSFELALFSSNDAGNAILTSVFIGL